MVLSYKKMQSNLKRRLMQWLLVSFTRRIVGQQSICISTGSIQGHVFGDQKVLTNAMVNKWLFANNLKVPLETLCERQCEICWRHFMLPEVNFAAYCLIYDMISTQYSTINHAACHNASRYSTVPLFYFKICICNKKQALSSFNENLFYFGQPHQLNWLNLPGLV